MNLRFSPPIRRLLGYFSPYRTQLTGGLLCLFAATLLRLAAPSVLGRALDGLIGSISNTTLIRYCIILLSLALGQAVLLFLQRRMLVGVARDVEYRIRRDFHTHLQKLPLQFYQKQRTGDLMARATSDLASIRMLTGPGLITTANAVFAPALIIPLMCSINWRLTLLSLIPMPLLLVTTQVFSKRVHEKSRKVQEHYGNLTSAAQEVLTGMKLLRAYSQERNTAARFKEASRELVRRNLSLIRLSVVFVPLLQFFFALGHIAILWYGSYLILNGRLSIGQFVQITLYLGLIWAPMISFGGVINQYQRARASMERIDNILSIQPAIADSGSTLDIKDVSGAIEFNNLTFTYKGAKTPALKDISLHIAPGQTVAFVGSTGSGKTTLMNLVSRLLDAEAGQVLIDGRPIQEIPLRVLRRGIGYVPQESSLFSETIAENIAYGVEHDASEIELAATMAGLAEDVKEFPEGFETVVGERGVKLSGGQRQRTAIARALIKRPSILILDDALSAVDTHTEERILENLRHVRQGRTSLFVSHRVSTVRDADLIVVLDDGRVVEQGTQSELIARGGLYASMNARQQLDEELATC